MSWAKYVLIPAVAVAGAVGGWRLYTTIMERDECEAALKNSTAREAKCNKENGELSRSYNICKTVSDGAESKYAASQNEAKECLQEKGTLESKLNEAQQAAKSNDSRYLGIKSVVENTESDDGAKAVELGKIVHAYLNGGGVVEAVGSTCAEGLGNLYNLMVSVEDSAVKGEFVRVLDASNLCGAVPKGTDYIRFTPENYGEK
ncbi:hypothetical protein HZC30_04900 [Candidatus Woesearchaeota archaeon]|nr:hypothetical protein [Candidatus Woesearchaeota archaeon]